MRQDFEKLFSHLPPLEPPVGLYEKITADLSRRQRFFIIQRIIIFVTSAICSAIIFIPSLQMVLAEFAQSGFAEFFSLLFSDTNVVLNYWQSFSLSLLETLPAMSLIIILTITITFLESIKFLTRDLKLILSPKILTNN